VALGLRPATSGEVRIAGTPLRGDTVTGALALGAAGIPEDPVGDSVVAGLSVLEHMPLGGRPVPMRGLGIDWKVLATRTQEADRRTGLRMAPLHRQVSELSGGNIQRVVLTRALADDTALIVAAYPSRGLDIANTRRTQELLAERAAGGAGVLMVSEDLDELISLADRIVVMHNGHIAGTVDAIGADRMAIGRLMLGGAEASPGASAEASPGASAEASPGASAEASPGASAEASPGASAEGSAA
jgi:simple sugar transport system ATP-binding protein